MGPALSALVRSGLALSALVVSGLVVTVSMAGVEGVAVAAQQASGAR